MKNCIFCKILEGQANASFVYKGEKVTAFMDLNPINKGHVLVIPNHHHERFSSLPGDMVCEMFSVAQNILRAIEKSSIPCEGANLFLSDGKIAGQEVPHSHLHIAPRFLGDGHRMGFLGTDPSESSREKLNATAALISDNL